MDKKVHARPVKGGIVHTRYESDAHSNQLGLTDEEALTTEVPVEYVEEGDYSHKHGPKSFRDVDSGGEY
ncbi:MAG TPA: hypothetical protein V6D05_14535 [Stenomitos sp.]